LIDFSWWEIDSTAAVAATVRAHKSAAVAVLKEGEPKDNALGRSRGGFSCKIHWVSATKGLPLVAVISSGAANDAAYFYPVLEQVKIPVKKGRKRTRPKEVVADKAYDAAYVRKELDRRAIKGMIPERQLRPGMKVRKKGLHYRFDKDIYKRRASVEQSIGWVKEFRRVATRYEKLALSFTAMVKLVFISIYLNKYL
jgi:transposase